jgi:hypothetical protein
VTADEGAEILSMKPCSDDYHFAYLMPGAFSTTQTPLASEVKIENLHKSWRFSCTLRNQLPADAPAATYSKGAAGTGMRHRRLLKFGSIIF